MDEALTNDACPLNAVDNAESLLRKLLSSVSVPFNELDELAIMVIGAGTFPSFLPFITVLRDISPNIKKFNFKLIDPDTVATANFYEKHKSLIKCSHDPTVNIIMCNMDIKKYLINSRNDYYDLIYFERPDSSIFNMIFSYLSIQSSRMAIFLQESIPFLRNVAKPNTIIVGSFINKDDIKHLQQLLKFSLNIKTNNIYRRPFSKYLAYNFGLIGIIDKLQLPEKSPEMLSSNIKSARLYFNIFFLSSIVLFLLAPVKLKIISFYFVIFQIFFHQYGRKGIVTRFIFIIGQMLLCIIFDWQEY